MIVLAAALTLSINVELDLTALVRRARPKDAPAVTCGIKTVGYRFVGKPGQQFRYAGENWTIPGEGWIELIADRRRNTYAIAGKTLPLDVWALDQFGFREVPMPAPKGE